MGLFNALSRVASDYAAGVVKDFQRFKNREALEVLMASCAIIAAADGYVSGEERRKVVAFLQSSPIFGVFDTDTAVILFNKYAGMFQTDTQMGYINASQVLNRFRGEPEIKMTIVRLCILLAEGQEELVAARRVCTELGLRPQSFPELGLIGQTVRMTRSPEHLQREYEAQWPQIEQMEREAESHRRNTSYRCVAPPQPRPTGFSGKDKKDFFGD